MAPSVFAVHVVVNDWHFMLAGHDAVEVIDDLVANLHDQFGYDDTLCMTSIFIVENYNVRQDLEASLLNYVTAYNAGLQLKERAEA